jgi:hypothetical protein
MDKEYTAGMIDKTLMDTKLTHRKKCIGEYNDLYNIFHPNTSEKYMKTFEENENVYKTHKGIFTNMYDSAHRNGNIIQLFKNTRMKNTKDEKPKNTDNNLSSNYILNSSNSKEPLIEYKSNWEDNSNRIKNALEFSKNLLKGKLNKRNKDQNKKEK